MPISLDEINRALWVKSRAEGYCWCAVPMRALVDVRGLIHRPCGQLITGRSYNLTAEQRGQAVNDFYPPMTGERPAISDDKAGGTPAI